MKKYIIALACVTVAFAGCKKAKSVADVNVDIPYSETVVVPSIPIPPGLFPPGGLAVTLPGTTPLVPNSAYYFAQYGTSVDKVNSVTLKNMGMRITSPQGANFNFMDTMRVFISANGLPSVLAGHKYGIPKGIDSFTFDLTDQNLKEYFLKDTINVSFDGWINSLPPTNDSIRASTTFHLFANPLN